MPTTLLRRVAAPAIGTMLVGLVLLLGAAPYVHAASGGETIAVAVPGRVACADGSGTALGDNPTVSAGAEIVCTLAGYGAKETVDVTFDATPLATITMDDKGTGTYRFTVPAGLTAGSYALTFTGETSKAVGTFAFTLGSSSGSTSSGGSGGGGGSLAWTGVNVLAPVGAGLVLVAAGVGLTVVNRRRRGHG